MLERVEREPCSLQRSFPSRLIQMSVQTTLSSLTADTIAAKHEDHKMMK
jgi:hypothetical protein